MIPDNITTPLLKTARLVLRQMQSTDDQNLYNLRLDKDNSKYLDRKQPGTITEIREFIRIINEGIKQDNWLYWAICPKEKNELIGTICLWNFSEDRTMAEVGYELSSMWQGKGLMHEALQCVLNYGFKNLQLKSINAFTHKENNKSTNLLRKNGFKINIDFKDDINIHNIVFSIKQKDV